MHRSCSLIALFAFVVFFCGCSEKGRPEKVSASIDAVLANADSFELFSLNPMPMEMTGNTTAPALHGWEILGTREIADSSVRANLIEELYKSIRDGDDQKIAACFNPRHGIRAKHGDKNVELIICFQCIMLKIYEDGEYTGHISIADRADYFNEVLKKNNVPLATN